MVQSLMIMVELLIGKGFMSSASPEREVLKKGYGGGEVCFCSSLFLL